MLKAALLADVTTVSHGFFTRRGGVSHGVYDSLNCGVGSGDAPNCVRVNRARAMDRFGLDGKALCTASQIHSAKVVVVKRAWPVERRPEVDAMVTKMPGVALGVLSADCAPVLLADREAGVIGAAHAGWRGARGGVLEATVRAMEALGAKKETMVGAIGPCIRQPSYEVGVEFRADFLAQSEANGKFFIPAEREDHFRFDLPGYAAERLTMTGVPAVEIVDGDTFTDEDRFFSYRRAVLRGERDYGRALSAIALKS